MNPINGITVFVWSQMWQVTALLAIVASATRLVCRRRPHLAYMLWLLVLLKCLTPPIWSSPTGLFSWAQRRVMPAETGSVENDAGRTSAISTTPPRGTLQNMW